MSHRADSPMDSRVWQEADGLHLDVRGLECPGPLVEILGLIDRGEAGDLFIVHIDQEPVFLFPELEERGWNHEILMPESGTVAQNGGCRLRLVRMHA